MLFEDWVKDNFGTVMINCKSGKSVFIFFNRKNTERIKKINNFCIYHEVSDGTVLLLLNKLAKKDVFIGIGDSCLFARKVAIEAAKKYYKNHKKETNV